jgi:hypothetical protein
MSDTSFEETLVKLIAKKRNLGEDEAKAFVAALKESPRQNQIEEFVGLIANSAEAISKLPPQVQESITGFMSNLLLKSTSSSDWKEKVTAVGSILAGSEIEALKKEIQELKEGKENEKYNALMQKIDELSKKYDEILNSKLNTTTTQEQTTTQTQYTIHDMVKQWLNEIREGRALIKEMYKEIEETAKPPAKEEFDIEKAKEALAKLGYKIEGPITPQEYEQRLLKIQQDWEKRWQEERKKIEEETEKKIKAEMKRQEMLMQFGMAIADNLFGWMLPQGTGLNLIKKALQKSE